MRWSHRFDRSSTQDVVYPNIMLYCITHRSWQVLLQISNFLHVHFPSHGNQHFLNMNNEMNELNFWSELRYVLRLLQSFVTEGKRTVQLYYIYIALNVLCKTPLRRTWIVTKLQVNFWGRKYILDTNHTSLTSLNFQIYFLWCKFIFWH